MVFLFNNHFTEFVLSNGPSFAFAICKGDLGIVEACVACVPTRWISSEFDPGRQ